jgi:hypothetical protein
MGNHHHGREILMAEKNDLQVAYENFDKLREMLEFEGKEAELTVLEMALEAMNRHLSLLGS